jgi:hypothetical protein
VTVRSIDNEECIASPLDTNAKIVEAPEDTQFHLQQMVTLLQYNHYQTTFHFRLSLKRLYKNVLKPYQ